MSLFEHLYIIFIICINQGVPPGRKICSIRDLIRWEYDGMAYNNAHVRNAKDMVQHSGGVDGMEDVPALLALPSFPTMDPVA